LILIIILIFYNRNHFNFLLEYKKKTQKIIKFLKKNLNIH
jgi:hypothetical protein